MNVTDVLVIYSFIAAKRNRLRETLTKLNFNYAAKSRFKNFKKMPNNLEKIQTKILAGIQHSTTTLNEQYPRVSSL